MAGLGTEYVVNELVLTLTHVNLPFELLIIDDGSTDGTGKIADSMANKNSKIKAIHHYSNKGLGGVYRTGFSSASNRTGQ